MNTKIGSRKTYTKEQIESMKKAFNSAPKVEKVKDFKASEAIKDMAKEIHAMQEKGYSLSMILEMLNSSGFEVSLATLKSGISQAKAKKETKSKAKSVQQDLLNSDATAPEETTTRPLPEPEPNAVPANKFVQNTTTEPEQKAKPKADRSSIFVDEIKPDSII